MSLKKRTLCPGQEVIVVYEKNAGFVQEKATFREYRYVPLGKVNHQTPVFDYQKQELLGLDCFWLLPSDIQSPEQVERIQKELIEVQIVARQIAIENGWEVPSKIKDREIEKMAQENADRSQALILKFGFDPRDETWIEKELAANDLESKWFAYERQNGFVFAATGDEFVQQFNAQTGASLTLEDAKALSKKRMRYLLGAYHVRMSGNSDVDAWKKAATDFEEMHRNRETRMLEWSEKHKGAWPLVRVKLPVTFWYGPYFNRCIENIPHVFTDTSCQKIKEGVILRMVSYDPQEQYVRLDFTPDVRAKIKPDDVNKDMPWKKESADYEIWVRPSEFGTHIELIAPECL